MEISLTRKFKRLKPFIYLKNIFFELIYLLITRNETIYKNFKPPLIQIEPTNYCNLNCICCPISRSSRKKGFMDFNLFKKIIDDASQIGMKNVLLFLHGESFLHPQIISMISYIKSRGLYVRITTNGMLLNREIIDAILRSGVNDEDVIRFSLLGYSKEVHEKIMSGVKHEKVIKNIIDFLDLRKKYGLKGPILETFFLTIPENNHERKDFIKCWSKIVEYVDSTEESKSFREYKRKITTMPREKACNNLLDRIVVFWNGDVTICYHDLNGEYILGNLNKQSINEIWNSKKYKSIKKLLKEKQFEKIPLCSNCDF